MNQLKLLKVLMVACEEMKNDKAGETLGSMACIAATAVTDEHGRVTKRTAAEEVNLAIAKLFVKAWDDETSPSIPQPSLN